MLLLLLLLLLLLAVFLLLPQVEREPRGGTVRRADDIPASRHVNTTAGVRPRRRELRLL